jgi:hypothetical protein
VLLRFDHIASFVVNANHGILWATEKLRVANMLLNGQTLELAVTASCEILLPFSQAPNSNTSGYDSPEALALLDGPVEIYMPDMKYGDDNGLG